MSQVQRARITISAALILAIALMLTVLASRAHAQHQPDFRNDYNSPRIYSPSGEYLGNLNRNQFDPNSVSNPFGAGNPFRGNGVNNPFSPNYTPGLAPRSPYSRY